MPDHSWTIELGPAPRRRTLARGDYLFHRGDPALAIFAVERGRLRLERTLADGGLLTLATVRAPQGLAEAALFAERYHCDARAETASAVGAYDKAAVLAAVERDPRLARRLLARLARQVQTQRALLELRNVRPASERVMHYLHLAAFFELDLGDRPLRALAAEIGLTPETLYRTLARLEASGRIVRRGREVRLADRSKP